MSFTAEELEEMAAADAAIDEEFAEPKRLKQRAYYARHREEIKAKSRAYYEKNREKALKTKRAYNEKHREELNRKHREYYAKHREEILEKQRARYQEQQKESADQEAAEEGGKGMELKQGKIYAEVKDGEIVDSEVSGTGETLIALLAAIMETVAKDEEFTAADLAGLIKKILEGYEEEEEKA